MTCKADPVRKGGAFVTGGRSGSKTGQCCGGASAAEMCEDCKTKDSRLVRMPSSDSTIGSSIGRAAFALAMARFGHAFDKVRITSRTGGVESTESTEPGNGAEGHGMELSAEAEVSRPGIRRAEISDDDSEDASPESEDTPEADGVDTESDDEGDDSGEGEGRLRLAQVGGGAAARRAAAGGGGRCRFKIAYRNLRNLGCAGGRCGAQIRFDITGVRARGRGCPPTLNGLMLTEAVVTDNGCTPGPVHTGAGCPITATAARPRRGTIAGCTDTYSLCAAPAAFPAAGCRETYTQQLFVGGVLAETHRIIFRITRGRGGCRGNVRRR